MQIRTIRNIEVFFQDLDFNNKENLFEFALSRNSHLHDLMEDESIKGIIVYEIEFKDGSKKKISHLKEERDEDWQVFRIHKFSQIWCTIYEWLYKKSFKKKESFEINHSEFEAEKNMENNETTLNEESEEQIQRYNYKLKRLRRSEEKMDLILEYDKLNSREIIKEGRYFDYFLEEWISPAESLNALEPLLLDVSYENFWDNKKATNNNVS